MNIEELTKKIKEINDDATQKVLALKKQYAEENNPYKVGDIIEDHIGKGKILSWKVKIPFYGYIPSYMVYECDNLTRNGTINKREPKRKIYQINIKQ